MGATGGRSPGTRALGFAHYRHKLAAGWAMDWGKVEGRKVTSALVAFIQTRDVAGLDYKGLGGGGDSRFESD